MILEVIGVIRIDGRGAVLPLQDEPDVRTHLDQAAADARTLAEFAAWLESRDLQAIGTRVSTGDECSIIIEDGVVAGSNEEPDFS